MPSPIKVFHYPKCSTCKKALAFLREKGIAFEGFDISVTPPTRDELRSMIERQGGIRPLFNTSGQRYREGEFAAKVATMSVEEAVEALAQDGMLVKRPFVLAGEHGLVGFKPEQWKVLITA